MAWETRKNGSSYYTRSRRVNGRVVREYYGNGLIGESAARLDEIRRIEKAQEQAAWEAQKGAIEALDGDLRTLDMACRQIIHNALVAAGYHQHHRGDWRRTMTTTRKKTTKKSSEKGVTLGGLDLKEATALVNAAQTGDHGAFEKFSAALPDLVKEMAEKYGQIGRRAETALIDRIAGKNLIEASGLERQLEQLRSELGRVQSSPLEQLLIERVICCWLQATEADRDSALAHAQGQTIALVKSEYYQKRQIRATRLFLQASKALAQVRKLLTPNIQVNIGEKQINVMGPQGEMDTQPVRAEAEEVQT